jgi:hypothetical protein
MEFYGGSEDEDLRVKKIEHSWINFNFTWKVQCTMYGSTCKKKSILCQISRRKKMKVQGENQ